MKCTTCGKTVFDGLVMIRQNPKGEAAIWACEAHSNVVLDDETATLVGTVQIKSSDLQ